jgi:AraC family ethanolamine operon transcriptional activator
MYAAERCIYIADIVCETISQQHQEFATMTTKMTPTTDPTPPPPHAMRAEFGDFEEFAEAIQGWGIDWVQLDRGSLHARLQQVATPSALLTRFRFSRKFHQRGTSPPGVRTFGFTGEQSPDIEWRGSTGTSSNIVVFPANDEFEVVSQPGFHGDTVSIPEDRIRSVADYMGLPDPLVGLTNGQAFIEIDRRRLVALRKAVSGLHARVARHGKALLADSDVLDVEFDVLSTLVAALQTSEISGPGFREPALRARALRLALGYLEDHANEPPSIQDICRASGVSWRTLDYAFRDRFGVTPKQYLQATRLHRVRHAILNATPEASILEIAADQGFWHMGQFAADYRRQFGELPSETLRKA